MNKKLSKIGLILIAIINCPYLLFLIGGLTPDPVANKIVAENTWFVIISPIVLIVLCVAGLFVKENNINKYRKCSKIFAVLRIIAGEFGVFCLTFYEVWQEQGVKNPLSIFLTLEKDNMYLAVAVIILLIALPLIEHIAALLLFEYGLEKEKRMKNLLIYKILLICLTVIALSGIVMSGIGLCVS